VRRECRGYELPCEVVVGGIVNWEKWDGMFFRDESPRYELSCEAVWVDFWFGRFGDGSFVRD
jgi:hypothetical protein